MSVECKGVTVKEARVVTREESERFYSDDELLELFDDDYNLVRPLLLRAQKAEAALERLQQRDEKLHEIAGCPPDCDLQTWIKVMASTAANSQEASQTVSQLPTTKDGKPILPEMEVWTYDPCLETPCTAYIVRSIARDAAGNWWIDLWRGGNYAGGAEPDGLFSTPQAAEDAKKAEIEASRARALSQL